MPDPLTTNIQLAVPTHGSDVDTWDQPLNGDFTILDACAGQVTSKAIASTPVTLTITEAQSAVIDLSGTLTADVTITLPAIYKETLFKNRTTGNFNVLVKGSTSTVVGLPIGLSRVFNNAGTVEFSDLPHMIGEEMALVTATVPSWITACTVPPYLLEDGSTFSAGTYPLLAKALGGTTLPDARGRSRANVNGGTTRITTAGSGIDGNTVNSAGGDQASTIAQANLPAVTLTGGTGNSLSLYQNNPSGTGAAGGSATQPVDRLAGLSSFPITGISIPLGGSGTPLNNMQPTYIGGITMIRAA